jgi:hypothetical protein
MTNEEVLNELHIKLVEGAKSAKFDFIQTSTQLDDSRSFLAFAGDKRVTVLLTATTVPAMCADVIFYRHSVTLSSGQVGDEVLKLLQR